MAWLARINELRLAANKPEWVDMFILYYRRSIIKHYRLAREINKVCADVANVVDKTTEFFQELDRLVGRDVPDKTSGFFKEIQRKDRNKVSQLQIFGREIELRARETDLFIEQLIKL
ncbi:hypothetical protein Tco_0540641 [Tanacetum coccineum]